VSATINPRKALRPYTLGFTASRDLTDEHAKRIRKFLNTLSARCYVTGAARGGDTIIGDHLATTQPWARHIVVVPANRAQVERWWTAKRHSNNHNIEIVVMPIGTDYRERNREIVSRSDYLFVVARYPETDPRSRRSGTWMTKRIAEMHGKQVIPVVLEKGMALRHAV
jgi:predicted Rossmann fold nucleotide-binding protein DprA/Smf involved in DNA uptake